MSKRVEAESCEELFYNWLDTLWMTPFLFRNLITVEAFRLLYLPYYYFEVQADIFLEYDAFVDNLGLPNRNNWQHFASSGQSSFQFFVAGFGTDGLPGREFFERIEPRSLSECEVALKEATDIRPFLLKTDDAWHLESKRKMEREQEERCKKKVNSERIRNFRLSTKIREQKSRRVFLPMYMCRYRFSGVDYYFAINAATGAVHGERPHSTLKPMLTGLTIIQGIALLRHVLNKGTS